MTRLVQLFQLIKTLPAEIQVGVKHAYVLALNRVYVITVAAGMPLLPTLTHGRHRADPEDEV